MYINFWYPIATADQVTNDAPFRIQVLGLKFVAFRDDAGKAHVLSDTCVHRGGSLGKGKIKNNSVMCPYHGWEFRGDGQCQLIPSIGKEGKIPARAKVDSYPTEERYGIVFAFLGDLPEAERPPIYEIEEWGKEGWRESKVIVLDVNYYYERSVENGLDPAHNEFVHPMQGFPGMEPEYRTKPLDIEEIPWGGKFLVQFFEEAVKKTQLEDLRSEPAELSAGSGHMGPNVLITWINFTKDNSMVQIFFEAPVDEHSTRIFFINMRNCMMEPENDEQVNQINLKVADEDIAVLNELDPVRTPESNIKEILMPSDQAVVKYREKLKEWEARGWRIDQNQLRAKRGDIAFAIPSPERRTSKNWVLDEIPLVSADSAKQQAAAE